MIKSSNGSTKLVYIKKLNTKKVELILNLIILKFRKCINDYIIKDRVNNFTTKAIITCQIICQPVIKMLYNLKIIINIFIGLKFDKYIIIYT